MNPIEIEVEIGYSHGGGVSSYADLTDKPAINNVTLEAGNNDIDIPVVNAIEQRPPLDGYIGEVVHFYIDQGETKILDLLVPAEYNANAQAGSPNKGNHSFIPFYYFNSTITGINNRLDSLIDGDEVSY